MEYIEKPKDGIEPLYFRTDECNATFINKTNQEGYIIENVNLIIVSRPVLVTIAKTCAK